MTDVIIMKQDDGWLVRVNGTENAQEFEVADDAVKYAHEQAKKIQGYVMVQDADGGLVQTASYRPVGVPDEETEISLES